MAVMDSTTKHTPGPWRYRDEDASIHSEHLTVAYVTRGVDVMPDENLGGSTFQANARLIAAAPDLLAALKLVLSEEGRGAKCDCRCVHCQAHRAIAKAEGR